MPVSRRGRIAAAVTAVLCLLVLALSAAADSQARIVRLSYVDGDVQVERAPGQGYERAFLNLPIVQGARLWTRNGLAEVEFEDGSTVRLAPESLLDFPRMLLRDSGNRVSEAQLHEGTAYFDVRPERGDVFSVFFGFNQINLRQSTRFRIRLDRATSEVAVFKGKLRVETSQGEVEVRSDETLTLDLSDPERYFLAKGVDEAPYDDWDREQYAQRDRYVAASSYNSYPYGYRYGLSDLNYYGQYISVPGYGLVWRPYGVDPFWDPFLDGAWVWYPGFGYVFVSAYPWGWTPYRYGTWLWIGGHGWCWRAGGWNRWHAIPVVHNPTRARRVPRPPTNPPRRGGVINVGSGPAFGPGDSGFEGRRPDRRMEPRRVPFNEAGRTALEERMAEGGSSPSTGTSISRQPRPSSDADAAPSGVPTRTATPAPEVRRVAPAEGDFRKNLDRRVDRMFGRDENGGGPGAASESTPAARQPSPELLRPRTFTPPARQAPPEPRATPQARPDIRPVPRTVSPPASSPSRGSDVSQPSTGAPSRGVSPRPSAPRPSGASVQRSMPSPSRSFSRGAATPSATRPSAPAPSRGVSRGPSQASRPDPR